MGENRTKRNRPTLARSGKFLALGTAGFATAMTLLMILAPGLRRPGPSEHRPDAGVKNTVSSPNQYSSTTGCAKATSVASHWNAATGAISGAASGSAKTCPKAIGYVGGQSYGDGSDGMSVAIPFKVASNGNHAISTAFSLKVASSSAFAYGNCPKFNVHYPRRSTSAMLRVL